MQSKLLRAHLNELLVFDVAARNGSFSKAARELGMTQSAVSHHVANLEATLGTRLFERLWRGIVLSEAGRDLQQATQRAFPALGDGMVSASRRPNAHRITIHTDFAVAAYYLMPRLGRLREAAGGADIRILTLQTASSLDLGPRDCGIVFGSLTALRARAIPLIHEVVLPVASPLVARSLGPIEDASLPRSRLLQLESEAGEWLDWNGYAKLAGLSPPECASSVTFNNYHLLIDAALAGDGVALGWRPLIDRFLEAGRLVAIGTPVVRPEWGYVLLQPSPTPVDRGLAQLLDIVRSDFARAYDGREDRAQSVSR